MARSAFLMLHLLATETQTMKSYLCECLFVIDVSITGVHYCEYDSRGIKIKER